MLGETLRAAREKAGLTVAQLAERTNLLTSLVEEMEQEDFHRIAAPIYGRGFIRLLGEELGLAPERIAELQREFALIYDGARAPQLRIREEPASVAPLPPKMTALSSLPPEPPVVRPVPVVEPTPVPPASVEVFANDLVAEDSAADERGEPPVVVEPAVAEPVATESVAVVSVSEPSERMNESVSAGQTEPVEDSSEGDEPLSEGQVVAEESVPEVVPEDSDDLFALAERERRLCEASALAREMGTESQEPQTHGSFGIRCAVDACLHFVSEFLKRCGAILRGGGALLARVGLCLGAGVGWTFRGLATGIRFLGRGAGHALAVGCVRGWRWKKQVAVALVAVALIVLLAMGVKTLFLKSSASVDTDETFPPPEMYVD